MPESAGGRRTLDKALDDMAGKPGAAVVYDVAVLSAWTDDADAGYYADESFSGDEMQIIVGKAEKIGGGWRRLRASKRECRCYGARTSGRSPWGGDTARRRFIGE